MSQAMSMKLHEITDEIVDICNELLELEGELTPELEARLDAANLALEKKLDNTLRWVEEQDAYAKGMKIVEDRIAADRKRREASVKSLDRWVLGQLQKIGRKNVQTELFNPTRILNPVTVEPADPEHIPEAFQRVRVEFDKTAAKAYLNSLGLLDLQEAGRTEIEGIVVERKERLRR
jgi:hypothetical protein